MTTTVSCTGVDPAFPVITNTFPGTVNTLPQTSNLLSNDYTYRYIGEYCNISPVSDWGKSKEELAARANARRKAYFRKVIFNNDCTIVLWSDGTKTVVKRQEGDLYDKEKGLLACIAKKYLGNNSFYNEILKQWCGKDYTVKIDDVYYQDLLDEIENLQYECDSLEDDCAFLENELTKRPDITIDDYNILYEEWHDRGVFIQSLEKENDELKNQLEEYGNKYAELESRVNNLIV